MRRFAIAACAAALLSVLTVPVGTPVSAETAGGTCAAETVLVSGADQTDSFDFTGCSGLGVNWTGLRTNGASVTWRVGGTSCTWPATGNATCSGPRPVPLASMAKTRITVTMTGCQFPACVVTFNWSERPQPPA